MASEGLRMVVSVKKQSLPGFCVFAVLGEESPPHALGVEKHCRIAMKLKYNPQLRREKNEIQLRNNKHIKLKKYHLKANTYFIELLQ